jgi:putative ABC transport system permease protein
MDIRPIASALTRNKTGFVLIALQVALTLAIVCNSVFIILQRLETMGRPTGVDEPNIFTFESVPFSAKGDMLPGLRADLDALRAMPGVIDATSTNSLPLSNGGWSTGVSKKQPDPSGAGRSDADTAVYLVDEHGLDALGLKLVAGRNFTADEIVPNLPNVNYEPGTAIVSQALAKKLFPDGDALGKTVWGFGNNKSQTIVGIVERMQAAWPRWKNTENSLLAPGWQIPPSNHYIVRTQPGQRDVVMHDVEQRMRAVDDRRIVHELKDYTEIRATSYRRDRAMAIMLVSVIVSLLVITGLGIVGMASFWVASRTKQIGTRRALGARRRDVLHYFQVENFLITGAGLALGSLLAYGFNVWLMQQYDLPRLAWWYVPAGAAALWALGQAAVLGPALRGAGVAPAVATRTV